jgi:hypothetical protein
VFLQASRPVYHLHDAAAAVVVVALSAAAGAFAVV